MRNGYRRDSPQESVVVASVAGFASEGLVDINVAHVEAATADDPAQVLVAELVEPEGSEVSESVSMFGAKAKESFFSKFAHVDLAYEYLRGLNEFAASFAHNHAGLFKAADSDHVDLTGYAGDALPMLIQQGGGEQVGLVDWNLVAYFLVFVIGLLVNLATGVQICASSIKDSKRVVAFYDSSASGCVAGCIRGDRRILTCACR